MTLSNEKVLISTTRINGLMPNLIKKSWTNSTTDALSARPRKASKCHVQKNSCIKKQLCISMNDSLWTFLTCRLKRESRNIITMQIEPFFLFLHCIHNFKLTFWICIKICDFIFWSSLKTFNFIFLFHIFFWMCEYNMYCHSVLEQI